MLRIALATALWCTTVFASEAPPSPALTFQATGLAVSGIEPGTTVYVYGIAREPKGSHTAVIRRETKLVDNDRDGRVEWDLQMPLPWRSIWLAVELPSGRHTVGVPPQYRLATRVELTSDHLKKDAAGEITQFGLAGSIIEFVVVRPKAAEIWGLTAVSGGPLDESGGSDKVRVSALNLQPRSGTTSDAPKSLKKGDVLFMMTSFRAQYTSAQVGD
jgi:hypothetical protein